MIGEDGEQLGVMDVRDAVQKARAAGVDLVEVAPNAQPPVCRMIDYGKFLYEEKKRAAEAKKKQVTVSVKEIKFRPGTDEHDYNYRMKHAREWLDGGDKVRAAIAFRGREMTHRELGAKILKKLTEDLADLAEVEVFPKMEGYQMFTIFVPKKAKVSKAKAAAISEKKEAPAKKEEAPKEAAPKAGEAPAAEAPAGEAEA